MNWSRIFKPVDCPAFQPDNPRIFGIDDLALATGASAVIGGIASLFGGHKTNNANIRAVRETNATNKEIAEATNKANMDLYQRQYEDAITQWNRENSYNNPSAEMQRLSSAGLNPALTYGSGQGASSMDLPSAAPAVGYTAETPRYTDVLGNSVQRALENIPMLLSGVESSARAKGQNLNNQYLSATMSDRIAKNMLELDMMRQKKSMMPWEKRILEQQWDYWDRLNSLNSLNFMDNVNSVKLDNAIKKVQLNQIEGMIENTSADTALKKLSVTLNENADARAERELRGILSKYYAEVGLLGAQTNFTNKTLDPIVEKYQKEIDNLLQRNNLLKQEYEHNKNYLPLVRNVLKEQAEYLATGTRLNKANLGFGIFDRGFKTMNGINNTIYGLGSSFVRK